MAQARSAENAAYTRVEQMRALTAVSGVRIGCNRQGLGHEAVVSERARHAGMRRVPLSRYASRHGCQDLPRSPACVDRVNGWMGAVCVDSEPACCGALRAMIGLNARTCTIQTHCTHAHASVRVDRAEARTTPVSAQQHKHAPAHTAAYAHLHMHTLVHTAAHAPTHKHAPAQAPAHTAAQLHTHLHTSTHLHTEHQLYTCTHRCTRTCAHTSTHSCTRTCTAQQLHSCTCTHLHTQLHTHTSTYPHSTADAQQAILQYKQLLIDVKGHNHSRSWHKRTLTHLFLIDVVFNTVHTLLCPLHAFAAAMDDLGAQHIVTLCSERALIVVCAACYKKGGHLISSSFGVLGRLQS